MLWKVEGILSTFFTSYSVIMHKKILYAVITLLLLFLWYCLSYEEVRTVLRHKWNSILYERIWNDEEKGSYSSIAETRKNNPIVDRVVVFTGDELTVTAQGGKRFENMEIFRILYPWFNELKAGGWLLFTYVSGSGMASPSTIYFEEDDLIETTPRFYGLPLSRYATELASSQWQKKYYAPCIAYVKGYHENPEIDTWCGQFIINDYWKKSLGIIINAQSWTQFTLSKVVSNY